MLCQIYGLNIASYERLSDHQSNHLITLLSPCFFNGTYCLLFLCLFVCLPQKNMVTRAGQDLVCLVHHWFRMEGFYQRFAALPLGFPGSWQAGWGMITTSLEPGVERMRRCFHRSPVGHMSCPLVQAPELGSWHVFPDPVSCRPSPHYQGGQQSSVNNRKGFRAAAQAPLTPLSSCLLQRCLDDSSTQCVSDTTRSTLHKQILHISELVLLPIF